jgi:hypothetical protein
LILVKLQKPINACKAGLENVSTHLFGAGGDGVAVSGGAGIDNSAEKMRAAILDIGG